MIRYGRCKNIDEDCPKAKSGELISIDGAKEFVCPDCGKELFEVEKPQIGPPWKLIATAVGVLLLTLGIAWAYWPEDTTVLPKTPLGVTVSQWDCQSGLLSLTATGGDGSPITYRVEGLSLVQSNTDFSIPVNQRADSLLSFYAVQNGSTVHNQYKINCQSVPPSDTGSGPQPPIGGDSQSTGNDSQTHWNRVANSEFCDPGTCTLLYSESDHLGHTRERRIENYAKCCPVNK